MFQIITGRFFGDVECHINEKTAALFSNYQWVRPISIGDSSFKPASNEIVATWIWTYFHRHPRETGNFAIVEIGTHEVLDQFRCFAIFGLRAFFSFRQRDIEHLCRTARSGQGDNQPPSALVKRYFDQVIYGTEAEEVEFKQLVDKALKLPRDQFKAVVRVLYAFRDALEALDSNIDLAYSILVYSIESLGQQFDQFTPTWDAYDVGVRSKIDSILAGHPELAAQVREALLDAAHLKLRVRFIDFCTAHLTDDFFTREAESLSGALQRIDLEQCLDNAYSLRSGYVHILHPIIEHVKHPGFANSDTFTWEGKTYATFSGLLRITRHILKQVIVRGEMLQSETAPWRDDLPGIIRAKMAPQYWISNPSALTPKNAANVLADFMSYMLTTVIKEKQIVDMLPVMEKIESLVPKARDNEKIALLCFYYSYHAAPLNESMQRPKWKEFFEQHGKAIEVCNILTMATAVFVGATVDWTTDCMTTTLEDYKKKRSKGKGVQFPIRVYAAVIAAAANRALIEDRKETFTALAHEGVQNAAGLPLVQAMFTDAAAKQTPLDVDAVLGWQLDKTDDASNGASAG